MYWTLKLTLNALFFNILVSHGVGISLPWALFGLRFWFCTKH